MAKPNTYWLFNNTANDDGNAGGASGGAGETSSFWVVIDLVNDLLLFLDSQQMDGDGESAEKYPVIIPESGSVEAPKTFVQDDSANILDQVPLAGTTNGGQSGGDTRHVFAIYFDGATAGIPKLEFWDDSDHDTCEDDFLGGGTPADSTIKGVATTNGAPGSATWAGAPLSGTTQRIDLDSAALTGAKNLYFNLKQVIASTFTAQSNSAIVSTLRFLYS